MLGTGNGVLEKQDRGGEIGGQAEWRERMKTCQKAENRRYCGRMSVNAEKVAEVLALPEQDRAYLARQLIASLDDTVDADAEEQWNEVIDRRSREMAEGRVDARPEEDVMRDIRAKLRARHPAS
jgi:putative addiction module component (TIGR02574 family)